MSKARGLLLDTHVLLWWLAAPKLLSRAQAGELARVSPTSPATVADITLWEVASLHAAGHLKMVMPVRDWLAKATAAPLVSVVSITPAIAAEAAALPGGAPRDPVDRLLLATARVLDLTLVTRDKGLLASELVRTLG